MIRSRVRSASPIAGTRPWCACWRPSAGFGARRFAVIDVGTNSVKFHVGERAADGAWTTIVDRAEVTRLGEGLGGLGPLRRRADRAHGGGIAGMADEAREEGVAAIAAVGTAGTAPGGEQRGRRRRGRGERTGIEIEVISGDRRGAPRVSGDGARAPARATGRSSPSTPAAAARSSRSPDGDRVDEQFSRRRRRRQRHGALRPRGVVETAGLEAALEASRPTSPAARTGPPGALVGMGGTITNLTAVQHGLADVRPASSTAAS